jgi:hypothetical protein
MTEAVAWKLLKEWMVADWKLQLGRKEESTLRRKDKVRYGRTNEM